MTEKQENKDPKIFKQIPKVMADIKPIGKDQVNQAQRFKFRGIDDVYNHVQSVLSKHKVFTVPEILGRERHEVQTRSGGKAYHCVTYFKFKFYAEDGSFVEAYADGEAMDTGDKAANKCAAIAHKYALIQTLCIPTAELNDPDSESHQLANTTVQTSSANQPPQRQGAGLVTQKQLGRLFAIGKKSGMREENILRLATQQFGVKSLTQLDQASYQRLCEVIEGSQNSRQEQVSNLNDQYGL